MPQDAFETYRGWFLHHYGREFACTREQWDEWCKRGRYHAIANALTLANARTVDVWADQWEIDRERQEGWAYGYVR